VPLVNMLSILGVGGPGKIFHRVSVSDNIFYLFLYKVLYAGCRGQAMTPNKFFFPYNNNIFYQESLQGNFWFILL
jgi:hypothetical protein